MNLPGVVELLRLDETPSTQDAAKGMAQAGAAHGTLVWARRQTAGRGQFDRRWESAEGGLYFSLIWRPALPHDRLAALSLACAGAVATALADLAGVETRVKPPNDVLASKDGRGGKVCGILLESSGTTGRLDWVVAGVGVNVNNRPSLETATSLSILAGRDFELEAVLRAVLDGLRDAPNRL